jgi:hypothetical protein
MTEEQRAVVAAAFTNFMAGRPVDAPAAPTDALVVSSSSASITVAPPLLPKPQSIAEMLEAEGLSVNAKLLQQLTGTVLKEVQDPLDRLARGPVSKATLVVVPVVALTQWRYEIIRHTAPGTLKVVIYHGANRASLVRSLTSADVVLTTYSILEAEFRKVVVFPFSL